MYEQMNENISDVLMRIVNEFCDKIPTTFVATDFDVEYLKISLAYKNKHIDDMQMCVLCSMVDDCERLWKKLNDVK